MHDPIPQNEVLEKHVNFCGVDRPCERPMIEEEKYVSNISMKEQSLGLEI